MERVRHVADRRGSVSSARSSAAGIELGATRAAAAATARSRITAFTGVGIPCAAPTRTTSPLNASASIGAEAARDRLPRRSAAPVRAVDLADLQEVAPTLRPPPPPTRSRSRRRRTPPAPPRAPVARARPRRHPARRSPRPRCRGSSAASCTSTASRRAPRGRRTRRAPSSATRPAAIASVPPAARARCRTARDRRRVGLDATRLEVRGRHHHHDAVRVREHGADEPLVGDAVLEAGHGRARRGGRASSASSGGVSCVFTASATTVAPSIAGVGDRA